MRDPDLDRIVNGIDVSLPSGFFGSLHECNQMVPPYDQAMILEAAWLAHNDRPFDAERARAFGGYDYEARKADHASRGISGINE